MRKTFKFKLFGARRNRKLHQQINVAGLAYNHCIALHKRYYSLYHKHLNLFRLQKHLTKQKRLPRFAYLKEIGSQAPHDVAQRIEKGYHLFFLGLQEKRKVHPPKFRKVRKTKSFTLKQTGCKLDEEHGVAYIQGRSTATTTAAASRAPPFERSLNIEDGGRGIVLPKWLSERKTSKGGRERLKPQSAWPSRQGCKNPTASAVRSMSRYESEVRSFYGFL